MRMNNRKSSPRRSKKRHSLKRKGRGRAKSPKRRTKRRSLRKKGGFVELPTNQV